MSVLFTAEHRQALAYVVTCGCAPATEQAAVLGSYGAAVRAAEDAERAGTRRPLPGCVLPDICPYSPLLVEPLDPDGRAPEVEANSANAQLLLSALGLDSGKGQDAWGQMAADLFLGRVLIALALTPEDPGVPWTQSGRHYDGGRSAGYLRRRLLDLHALAEWCAAHGREVSWA
ncbi:hypothetical protein [Streptomyces sp. NPDC004658]|uniref:hypothetical protein n=1 Tax=Streptomyces sp. NPDC004658 TaxID=3154672 RepID=UPI0033BF890E